MKKFFNSKLFLITAGIMLAFCFVIFYVTPIETLTHEIINIFAGGRSTMKIYLFFGYIILLLVIAMLQLQYRFNWYRLFVALLLGAYSYGVLLHILVLKQLSLRLTDFVIVFNNNEISSTTLTHIHTLKSVLALILSVFGVSSLENSDNGAAFLPLFHPVLVIIGLIFGVLLIIGFINLFIDLYHSYTKTQTTHGWQILFIFVFGIITFSLIKNYFDGGLLNRETSFAFSALLFLMFPVDKFKITARPWLWRLSPVLMYLVVTLLINYNLQISWSEQWALLFQALSFGVILGVLLYLHYHQQMNRPAVLLIIMGSLLLFWPTAHAVQIYYSDHKTIPQEEMAYIGLLQSAQDQNYKLIEKINQLYLYQYNSNRPYSVQELIDKHSLLNNLGSIKVPWNNCLPAQQDQTSTFLLISKSKINTASMNSEFIDLTLTEESMQKGMYHYNVTMTMSPCAPRPLNIVENLIKQSGTTTFFISNIKIAEYQNL